MTGGERKWYINEAAEKKAAGEHIIKVSKSEKKSVDTGEKMCYSKGPAKEQGK